VVHDFCVMMIKREDTGYARVDIHFLFLRSKYHINRTEQNIYFLSKHIKIHNYMHV